MLNYRHLPFFSVFSTGLDIKHELPISVKIELKRNISSYFMESFNNTFCCRNDQINVYLAHLCTAWTLDQIDRMEREIQ
jgi:hypothetical protein